MIHTESSTREHGSAREQERANQSNVQLRLPTPAQRQAQFQVLVARTRQRLYRFALHKLGNSQDAEDVAQETLVRAWTYFDTFDLQRSFEAWVFRIANNIMIDQIRRRRRRHEVSLDAPETSLSVNADMGRLELSADAGNPQDRLMIKEMIADLLTALHTLPSMHRSALLLVAQGHSYEEIASAMACPVGTVRSRVHRARRMLILCGTQGVSSAVSSSGEGC